MIFKTFLLKIVLELEENYKKKSIEVLYTVPLSMFYVTTVQLLKPASW